MKITVVLILLLLPFRLSASNTLFTFGLEGTMPPATDYATGLNNYLTTEWPFVWANRCADIYGNGDCPNDRKFKGNYYHGIVSYNGKEVRPQFTTVKKADACTRINVARSTNVPESFVNNLASLYGIGILERPGLEGVIGSYLTPIVNLGIERYFLVDICVASPRVNVRPTGIIVDYEVHDRRSVDELAFLAQRIKLANQNRTVVWFINSLIKPSTRTNNATVDAGLAVLNQYADYIAPIIWSGATPGNPAREIPGRSRSFSPVDDFANSLGLIGEAKFLPFVSLYDVSVNEVQQMRNMVNDPAFGVWRNYQQWQNNLSLLNCLAGISCN